MDQPAALARLQPRPQKTPPHSHRDRIAGRDQADSKAGSAISKAANGGHDAAITCWLRRTP